MMRWILQNPETCSGVPDTKYLQDKYISPVQALWRTNLAPITHALHRVATSASIVGSGYMITHRGFCFADWAWSLEQLSVRVILPWVPIRSQKAREVWKMRAWGGILGLETGIVLAPMGPDISSPELVAAVANAGGLGLLRAPSQVVIPSLHLL